MSCRSAVYRPVGLNSGGFAVRVGISASGSPTMLHVIRYLSGRLARTARTFLATGLYLRLANVSTCSIELLVESAHCSRVYKGSIKGEFESEVEEETSDKDTYVICKKSILVIDGSQVER